MNVENPPQTDFRQAADFESFFEGFPEQSAYVQAEDILFTLAKSAYQAGWNAAEGKASPQRMIHLSDSKT